MENFIGNLTESAIKRLSQYKPDQRDSVLSLLSSSEYLLQLVNNNSDILPDLTLSGFPSDYDSLKKQFPDILVCDSYDVLYDAAREIKQRLLFRIAYQDFTGRADVSTTVRHLSTLADLCIDLAARASFTKCCSGSITPELISESAAITGMGKLGGMELNISSDIDLIFYTVNAVHDDIDLSGAVTHFFISLMDFLRTSSAKGFLYRVDMRLRPDGVSGELFSHEHNAVEYYKNRASLWELQAMIKSRHIWGNSDITGRILRPVHESIYDFHEPEKVLFAVRHMKKGIEDHLGDDENDIKLGPGGIRDIEFIVQFLQLIHGARHTDLREQNTLTALWKMEVFGILSRDEYNVLSENYILLRKIENILQLKDNLQIHVLPHDDVTLENLLRGWTFNCSLLPEFTTPSDFRKNISHARTKVRLIFESLFDISIEFIKKKNTLFGYFPDISDNRYFEHHFRRLDSEYFLNCTADTIAVHLKMIMKLNYSNLSEILIEEETSSTGNTCYRITIAAFDYDYEFSKIAGLLSSYCLMILDGESYTYAHFTGKEDGPDNVYRRSRREVYRGFTESEKSTEAILKKKKIILSARVRLSEGAPGNYVPDWKMFKQDMDSILKSLESGDNDEATRLLNDKLYIYMSSFTPDSTSLSPVTIDTDNESSSLFTILTIESNDSFAFLYTFTHTLAIRNFYIYKIIITTVDETVYDRIFVMTSDGKKITDTHRLDELRITVALIKQYTSLLHNAADPHRALTYFENLISRILESNEKNELPVIGQHDVQENLAAIFGTSSFIWEDLLRFHYKEMLPMLNSDELEIARNRSNLRNLFFSRYPHAVNDSHGITDEFIEALNFFKDIEMFRIDTRQIIGKTDFWKFALELSELADCVIKLVIDNAYKHMMSVSKIITDIPWAVFGLGKLGGRELGYASDIELMFIYDVSDTSISAADALTFFEQMLQLFIRSIKAKKEGIFEIDMNLRPYGKSGSLAVSLQSFREYFSDNGKSHFFERQALVKMRCICSNDIGINLRNTVLDHRDSFVYSTTPINFDAVYKVRNMQLESYIDIAGERNIKYAPGMLVEAEYTVQILQIHYGNSYNLLRQTSTLDALSSLIEVGVFPEERLKRIEKAYKFYRRLINILRMVRGNAKDLTLYKRGSVEHTFLLRRALFTGLIKSENADELEENINMHAEFTESCFRNLQNLIDQHEKL